GSSTAAVPTYAYAVSGTYSVKLKATSAMGCIDSASASVIVKPVPVVNFTQANVCDADIMSFSSTASTIASGSISSRAWNFGDASTATGTSVTHTYPADGSYPVTLVCTSNLGCKDSLTKTVTVYPLPVVSFTHDSTCLGGAISFVNGTTITSGNLTYNWDLGDGNNSTAVNPAYVYLAASSYNVTLTATSANYNCTAFASQMVNVFEQPVADFAVANVCSYDSVVTVNTTNTNGATVTYGWDFGDGGSSTLTSPAHFYLNPGTYPIILSVNSDKGCISSKTKSVIVNAVPSANYSLANLCDSSSAVFTNLSFLANGSMTYFWDMGDGTFSAAANPVYTYAVPGTYNTQLIATSNNGCTDTLQKQIIVHPLPVPDFSLIETCPGSPSGFNNTSAILTGNISSYNWDFGDGTNSVIQNPAKTYPVAGNYTVTLTATSNNGCSQNTSQVITVTSSGSPGNVRGNVTGSANVCFGINGGSLLLTGQTGSVIQWEYQDSGSSTWTAVPGNTNAFSYSNLTLTRYFRVLTQITTCSTDYSDTATVTVNPLPVVGFNAADVCKGQTSMFINSTSIPVGSISGYSWDFGNGASSIAQSPQYVYPLDGTYSVLLTVTSSAGCIDTLRVNVNVNPIPAVFFTQTNICLHNFMAFTNTSSVSSGSISNNYWSFGNGDTSTTAGPVYLYPADGSYSVELVVTSANGCKDSLTKAATVYPRAAVNFVSDSVCIGSNTHFTNLTTIVSGNLTFTWDFGDTQTSAQINPNHQYAVADTFAVTLISTSAYNCKDTLVQNAVVFGQPTSNFALANVCAYDSAGFTNTSLTGGSALNYTWDFGDGFYSSASDPMHLFPNPGTYLVKLTVNSAAGCTSSLAKNITIYQVPTANFTVANVCDTVAANYINLSNIAAETLSHVWTFGDGNSSAVANPTHLYSAFGTYNLQLISSSSLGCTDTAWGSVTVYPRPVANFSAPAVCDGYPTVFTDSSSVASGTLTSYSWDFGDGTNSIVKNPLHQFLNPGTYPVKLIPTSDKGCSNEITINAVINVLPVADFTFISECDSDPIVYSNTSFISTGTLTYVWSFGDGQQDVLASPTHLFASGGTWYSELLATSDLGCKDSITKPVGVYSIPQPDAGTDTSVSMGYSVTLNATGGANYFWFPATGLSSTGISNPVATPMETTIYVLTVIDANGCIGYDTVVVNVKEDFKLVANNVFTPNGDGVNDYFKIENIETYALTKLSIFDRWGQLVYSKKGYANTWDGTAGQDILPDGTYYYAVTFDESGKVYKGSVTLLRNK
ncbi:MAG: PKD domain-containing protein, partial [Bacteroidia bacterium]